MGKNFDYKKMRAEVRKHQDLMASFQNPKKKKSDPTPSSSVIGLEASSNRMPSSQITPSLIPPALSSSKPSSSQNLLLPGLVSQAERGIRLDHLFTTASDPTKHLLGTSNFPTPYDAEMMAVIGAEDCFDAGEVMLGRCMAIFQHFKVVAQAHSNLQNKVGRLEKQVQELLKNKSERDSVFLAKELELSQCQELNRQLDADIGHLKKKLKDTQSQVNLLKEKIEQLSKGEAEWKVEKAQLQKARVNSYKEGFMKAVRQALLFSPELQVTQFHLDKKVVDGQLVDD